MKKLLVGLLIVLATAAMLHFTGILSDIQNALFNHFQQVEQPRQVFYFGEDVTEDPHSAALLEDADRQFVPLRALRAGDVSAMYYDDQKSVVIQTLEDRIVIDSNGNVRVNGSAIEAKVGLRWFGDLLYLSASDLNAFEAGNRIGVRVQSFENGSMYVTHERRSYAVSAAPIEIKLFPTARWVVEGENTRRKLFDFSEKTPFHGESDGEGYLFADSENPGFVRYFGMKGVYGYARSESFADPKRTEVKAPQAKSIDYKKRGRLVMTWEGVYGQNPDIEEIPDMPGLNAISPTWYTLEGVHGEVSELVSKDYLEWARSKRYEMWPLIKNQFEDIQATSQFLASLSAQQKAIRFLVDEAVRYGFHGINVDFEHVYLKDRDALTNFINMLAFDLRAKQIMISADVTVTGGADNWSRCYDHAALGKIVDYLVIMTYDEHYASSPVAGPVASFGWVKHHMEILADLVEPQKLILGLPFYTRLWVETTNPENPTRVTVKSSALSMLDQNEVLQEHPFDMRWEEETGMFYATRYDGNVQYKMWVENAETIAVKATLVDALKLGGVAGWRRAYETPDIWDQLKLLHKKSNP